MSCVLVTVGNKKGSRQSQTCGATGTAVESKYLRKRWKRPLLLLFLLIYWFYFKAHKKEIYCRFEKQHMVLHGIDDLYILMALMVGWDHSMRKHSGRSKNQVVWPQTTFTQFVSRWWFHDYDNLVWCSGMRRSSMILTVLVFWPSVNNHRLRNHLRKKACFSCDTYLVINEKVATVEWRGITTPWPWWPPHGHLMVGGQKRTLSNKVHECRTHRLFLEFNVLTSTLGGVAVASTDN